MDVIKQDSIDYKLYTPLFPDLGFLVLNKENVSTVTKIFLTIQPPNFARKTCDLFCKMSMYFCLEFLNPLRATPDKLYQVARLFYEDRNAFHRLFSSLDKESESYKTYYVLSVHFNENEIRAAAEWCERVFAWVSIPEVKIKLAKKLKEKGLN